jgi:hypothetical protein
LAWCVRAFHISLVLMFFIARKAISKIKTEAPNASKNEEDNIGKDS